MVTNLIRQPFNAVFLRRLTVNLRTVDRQLGSEPEWTQVLTVTVRKPYDGTDRLTVTYGYGVQPYYLPHLLPNK